LCLIRSNLRSKTTAWQASVLANFFYVYILVSEADATQHYTGITQDLPSCLNEHNQGTCIDTARCRRCRIETAIAFRSEAKARAFEKYLQPLQVANSHDDICKLPPSASRIRPCKALSHHAANHPVLSLQRHKLARTSSPICDFTKSAHNRNRIVT